MDDNSLLVTLTIADLRKVVKDILAENAEGSENAKESLLSPEEARKVWQPAISKVTLHRWTKDGLLPVHRIGGRIYYKRSEITEAVNRINVYDHYKQPA